jgi:hypothetical protein
VASLLQQCLVKKGRVVEAMRALQARLVLLLPRPEEE